MASKELHSQSLPSGTRIEEFVIERVLGSGGFGITYLAQDTTLGRQVVIKENLPVQFCFRDTHSLTVAPRHSHGEDAENFQWSLENFSKEAAMLASLDHSGIVRVHRSLQAFGTAYFVMPFVKGLTFEDLIRERQNDGRAFSEEELVGLLTRVLKALSYLHDRGIYHRDIKPGNILITHEGIPVLIDFGSARQRLSERSMTVVESAGYTPFEQLQSRGNVGPWSDLYALGGTLVKAITGEALPKANDRVFDDPWQALTSRSDLLPAFSASFLECIDRALALHPRDRWQDAGEWLTALSVPSVSKRQPAQVIVEEPALPASPVSPPVQKPAPSSKYQSVDEREFDLVPGCKIRMCWIPPGEFLMGSPEDEPRRCDDETQHRVIIRRGFWMGKYPVTQEQWDAVTGIRADGFGDLADQHWKRLPVVYVSWSDICYNTNTAKGFLRVSPNGLRFELPTEAEWEYACRAGNSAENNKQLEEVAWYCANSAGSTQPVGLKEPNAWGLHDMLGNVWEWCADRYGVYPNGPVTDSKGAASGDCRVLRGGGWSNDALRCRMACRDYNYPRHANDNIGFRLVLRTVP
jgi:formylglycine-generating enzyme required for sulfatase activity